MPLEMLETNRLDGSTLKSTFFTQSQKSSSLAIIYPGAGYSCNAPLFYYQTNFLMDLGFDVLNVEYDYRFFPERTERNGYLSHDIKETFRAVAPESYQNIIISAKSLGTRGIADSLSKGLFNNLSSQVAFIWQTPCWDDEDLFLTMKDCTHKGLHIIGTKDPLFSENKLRQIENAKNQEIIVIENADHGLDIDGDVEKSQLSMLEIQQQTKKWILRILV